MKKSIVLCADDYGQAPAIDAGILQLCARKRLTAVSCLVTTPYWQTAAKALKPFVDQVDIGLHFNLTHGHRLATTLRPQPLSRLIFRALLRQLDEKELIAEWHAQLDAFEAAMGRQPDFIDGHQHVHQFPVIRQAMLNVYASRLRPHATYIRLSRFSNEAGFKANIINYLGGYAAARDYQRAFIPHNPRFAGAYAFARVGHYCEYFQSFLKQCDSAGLIMCHPGEHAPDDELSGSRQHELDYFLSDQFLTDCQQEKVTLCRFQEAFIV